ncbi:hypothetical protein B9Z55_007930 [Caenorhabditis nigoni]|uniref:BTB domain-containing protein n=1 Tax=Caenorhabditis nigoni TaxID=1611254 RepID=A0A2G5VC06_9PELO|nr:hypothetical protein B9Z55_007930 [Caenorhabditis nigoni]
MTDNKEFIVRQVFNNLSSLKNGDWMYGDAVKRFGVDWRIQLYKNDSGNMYPHLLCESPETGDWSIITNCDVIVGGKSFKTGLQFKFTHNLMIGGLPFIKKRDFANYGIDESASIEFHVRITEMTGIKKRKSMNFDDDVAKEASDVVLIVGDQKFYVNKMYLSLHSTYFKTLFSGNFSESKKSIIELKDIDPKSFQNFLDILYAVSLLENDTVSEILKLADFFDAKIVVQRCEEFLMNHSKESLKFKFQLAIKYKLAELKNKCFSEMTKTTNFKELIPENAADFDSEVWKEFSSKAISFL